MRLGMTFAVAWVFVWSASGQIPEDELRVKVRSSRYGALAEQARIQGDVHLSLRSGLVTLLSGHPLLSQAAVESAKSFGSLQGAPDISLVYHFVLVDTTTSVPTPVRVKRGNAFERAILRMFGFKTEKVVTEYQCQEGVAPPNDLKASGATAEVWIYGRTHCLMTEATLVAHR